MDKRSTYLSKNIFLFGISSFGPKILAFLMVPLYTNYLTTADYGIGDIISTTASLTLPLIALCIESAILRFSFEHDINQDTVLSNGLYVFSKGILFVGLLVACVAIIPLIEIDVSYLLAFFLMILSTGLYDILSNYARGVERVGCMVEMSLITTGISCLLNILFLVVLNFGLNGYLVANYLGTLIAVIWGIIRLKIWKHFHISSISKPVMSKMKKYSFPLVFNRIGWWLNSSLDKYIITWILGATSNGIYTVAYKIPTMLVACSDVFTQAWQLSAIKEYDADDRNVFVTEMYELYNGFLVMCCSGLMVLTIPLAYILFAKDFFQAWQYVPALMISFLFGGLSGFLGSIFMAEKDTKIFTYSTIIGATVNAILNVILVYLIGVMGAAVATLISNVVIWGVRLFHSRKYVSIKVNYYKHIGMYFLLIVQAIVCLGGLKIFYMAIQIFILLILIAGNRNTLVDVFNKMIAFVRKNRRHK